MPVDAATFRRALGGFATGVAVVTTADTGGRRDGLTVNSFSSVSLDPPLILFSLGRDADSRAAFMSATHFAVNILREDQEDLSARFAAPGPEKWRGLELETGAGGCPLLKESLATLECEIAIRYAGGDHDIFVGRVTGLRSDADARPLMYYRGGYRRLMAD